MPYEENKIHIYLLIESQIFIKFQINSNLKTDANVMSTCRLSLKFI